MSERKSWSEMEDKVLKLLRLKCGDKKWSEIAQLMKSQYGIEGRNGKQCRQRYHNHLDQRISKSIWNPEEDCLLLQLHNQHGNKWAHIARAIQGRTDNCVKNRFYSRFRRSIRVINEMIKLFWKKQFKPLKITFITKIIQLTQQLRGVVEQNKKQLFEVCQSLKCRLMSFSDCNEQIMKSNRQRLDSLYELIRDINYFNKKNKRRGKKKRRQNSDQEDEDHYLLEGKGKCQNPKVKNQNSKLSQKIKIQPVFQQDSVKMQNQKIIKTQFQFNIKLLEPKQQQMGVQIFTSHAQNSEIDRPVCPSPMDIYQQIDSKKLDTFQFDKQYVQQGFDINQFYSLENLQSAQKFYYY